MDRNIKEVLEMIENAGFEAYVIGGFVRDYLLGINSTDIDICTNALPKDLIKIFNSNYLCNEYGCFKIQTNKYTFDITTYRKEFTYINRRPTQVEYINNLLLDVERRDFTINTICMNSRGDIIDLLDGAKDIKNKIIRSVGNIEDKLREDPLRILRAIRFCITLDFTLDDKLKREIILNRELINTLSYTRKRMELDRILVSPYVNKGMTLLKELGVYELLEFSYDKLVPVNDVCAMYSQLNVSDKYAFSRSEKYMIDGIKDIINRGIIDRFSLYKHGLYLNTLAGNILNINAKEINEMYDSLPIKSRKELNIEVESICNILNIEPSSIIKTIQNDLIFLIINDRLNNDEKELSTYIFNNRSRWVND